MSIRLQLFGDSPVTKETSDIEIASIITPESKGDNHNDSGIDLLTPLSNELSWKPRNDRKSLDARRSLFSGKRLSDDDLFEESPCTKKQRQTTTTTEISDEQNQDIKEAVERLESRDLIADGSRDYILPTIPGKHSDLKSITSETMVDVINGKYDKEMDKVTIVDCRYPYEFEGGHIKDAVNMYTKDDVHSLLQKPVTSERRHILIFHCEFSSERGPKMYRFLRSEDRNLNKCEYPSLNFPEVYLLHGGYKEFYQTYQEYCDPISFKPMLHEDHGEDLRHFRVKSKSWTAGEKQTSNRRHRSRLNRNLSF
ncbi:M-phase inducer phosphatase 1 [Mactra antiquata]